jgi:signal transduction histidine kinase
VITRSAGLRVRMLATLLGAGMLVGALHAASLLAILAQASRLSGRHELTSLAGSVLVAVGAAMLVLVVLLAWLLGRQLVSPLAAIDAALERVGGAASREPLLPEGGDLIGRVAPAINRLEQRLAQERLRVQAQIAELKGANEALRAAREHAARSERLASVGRLAAGVAHEVGNPMTALIGFLSLLRERTPAGEALEYLDRIEREASRIDRILRDLLSLARPVERMHPVDLQRAAALALGLLRDQPSWAGAAAELRFPPDLPAAAGDEHYVVQVLVNLLTNARKAGARRIEVLGGAEGVFLTVDVADDGRGLPKENLDRLFEPFFTTGSPGEGAGLGLALCHATMERLGGSIEARSRAQGGASFLLRFRRWADVGGAPG